jgi:hypothetical protein
VPTPSWPGGRWRAGARCCRGVLVPLYHKVKGLTTLFHELTLERS